MTEATSDTSDDFALMQAIASADQRALTVLFDRYSGLVFTVCLRVLGDRQEAEDTLLEVFWELWEKADRYHPSRGAPRTYLMMLARSRAIDRKRSLAVRAGISVEAMGGEAEPTTDSSNDTSQPSQAAIDAEIRQLVVNALSGLEDTQRQAIELSFFGGMSHREIAKQLDTPLGTVKTRIRSGLVRLRDSLRRFFSEQDQS